MYYETPQKIGAFTVTFDYRIDNPSIDAADGAALVFQNQGIGALGLGGNGCGYQNVTDSVAVNLNIWRNVSEIEWGLNGVWDGSRDPTAPVSLISNNTIGVTVTYSYDFLTPLPQMLDAIAGGALDLTLTETTVMSLNPSV